MAEPLAYFDGRLVPADQLVIPAYDGGFVQGATVSEQMRTFRGAIFRLQQHLERLRHSLDIVGVDPGLSMAEVADIIHRLVAHNHPLLDPDDDLGVSLFITPGPYLSLAPAGGPLTGIQTYPLRFELWAAKYDQGQALVVSDIRQVPASCWPPELKCRSRMHYYLADKQAAAADPDARALLLDVDGSVSEASTANVVLYFREEGLVSPPRERILPGVSAAVLNELAEQQGIRFAYRVLTAADVARADEVILTGTSMCLLPVVRFNHQPVGQGVPGPIFQQLLAAWSEQVGVDIKAQAIRFSGRTAAL